MQRLQKPICPFSFAFNIRRIQPDKLIPSQTRIEISIGFACLEEKCAFYDPETKQCIIKKIADSLEKLSKK